MKRSLNSILLILLLVIFSGCRPVESTDEEILSKEFYAEDSMAADLNSPLSLTPGKQPTIYYESKTEREIENKDGGSIRETIVFFNDQDLSELSTFRLLESEVAESPTTYSALMEKVTSKNGLIVSGYAEGLREGHWSTYNMAPFTLTEFCVEKIYYGQLKETKITIRENYCPVSEKDRNYIEFDGHLYTKLKDHQKVLLVLIPTNDNGIYTPCYYELPLPEDYQQFDETTEQELLNYYRGDQTLRITQDTVDETTEYVNENGLIIQQFQYQDTNSWEKSVASEEEFLNEMNEHILVRLALDYKIKIWPKDHIRFSITSTGYAESGLHILS